MFEAVDRRPDREVRRRSAASMALTSAVCAAAVAGFLVGSAAWVSTSAPAPPLPEVVQLIEADPVPEIFAPVAPT